MKSINFKVLLLMAVCLASCSAFFYLNSQARPEASKPSAGQHSVSAAQDSADKEDALLPDANLLRRMIEKGKETLPVLIHFM